MTSAALSTLFGDITGAPVATIQGSGANGPTLVALAGVLLVYLASAWIHDRGRDPGLSVHVLKLPGSFGQNVFLWPLAGLLPAWFALAAAVLAPRLDSHWTGALCAALALAYIGVGQLLARHRATYRLRSRTVARRWRIRQADYAGGMLCGIPS